MLYQASLKQLRISYLSAILVLCLLAITAQGLIQWTLAREVDARHSATVIGSQSGRSLRMFFDSEAMLVDMPHTHTYLSEMQHIYPLWEQIQAVLPYGDSGLDIPTNLPSDIIAAIIASTPIYERLHANFAVVIQEERKAKPDWRQDLTALIQIIKDEPRYTMIFTNIYAILQTDADNEVTRVRIIEGILFLLFLLTINYEVFGIVQPAVSHVEQMLRGLPPSTNKEGGDAEEEEEEEGDTPATNTPTPTEKGKEFLSPQP